jgi:hypothetical protein
VVQGPDLYYTIHFQNTGTDTAYNIIVRDTLCDKLVIPSILTIGASHPYVFSMEPGGVAVWEFANIMLPDSGANLIASNGHVTFRIKSVTTLVDGDQIENTGAIYFDFNAPVITDAAVTIIVDQTSGTNDHNLLNEVFDIFPNPASDRMEIRYSSNGSGKLRLEVLSISGQMLFSEQVDDYSGLHSASLDLHDFPAGIVLVRIVTDQTTSMKKVVIVK